LGICYAASGGSEVAMEHNLRVYNTLTKQKEPFKTVIPGKVTMYVCGPTVYKPSHIGHMVGPVIFDTVKRYLTYLDYEVTWVVNITDVDDKLIIRARELDTTVKELAARMTDDYVTCLNRLNVATKDPAGIDHMPRATEHIAEMIDIMRGLIDKGYAYAAGGDVYFDVLKDDDYGKLCNRDPEQMSAGARIEVTDKKRNPGDFAMWKASKPGEPTWESPWGPGRPGWHIECSAMSMKLLGKTLDIHGGGLDLQFPHHENELAQSESFTGQPFANAWMHNGLLKMGTAKMAGSVGNVVNIVDLLQRHNPETVRFLLLSTHYRSPIEYSEDRLNEVARSLQGFYRFFERFQRITGENFFDLPVFSMEQMNSYLDNRQRSDVMDERRWRNLFRQSMNDDFNTGGAIGVLFELLTTMNRCIDHWKLETEQHPPQVDILRTAGLVLRELSHILGVFSKPIDKPRADDASQQLTAGLMQLLIDLRAEARKAKNFALGDQIRKRLGDLSVTLEDRPSGTIWRKD
jgi:cysteinyl-tRNA synthetase